MLKVIVIGSGNVGSHLVNMFDNSSQIDLVQWYSRSQITHKKIEVINNINFLKEADIYILCVSDNAIKGLSNKLNFKNKLVVHTSGSTSFQDICKKNKRGVFYPLQTFSKIKELDYTKIPICIESENKEDLELLKNLCDKINCKYYEINFEQRKTLHLAAVISNNFTNYLFGLSKEIILDKNLDFEILKPLINETVDKIHKLDPIESQTGPARRNDQNIIEMHINMLENQEHRNLYKIISQMIKNKYDN